MRILSVARRVARFCRGLRLMAVRVRRIIDGVAVEVWVPTLKMAPQARSCFRNAASLAGLKRAAARVRRALRSHRAAARAQAARANASKKWHTVPRRVRGAGPQFADGARIFLVTVRKHAWVGQNPEGGVLSIALCHSQARLHAHTEMWSVA